MLFDAWLRKQSLENAQGKVEISFWSGVRVCGRRLMRFVVLAGLFSAPVIVALQFGAPAMAGCHINGNDAATDLDGC
jgi:hypothetical protein